MPVNPHFTENGIENSIDFTEGRNKDEGEECGDLADSGRIVEVMAAEEELVLINNALKATAFISHNISQRRNTEGDEGSWKCEMTLDGGRILPTWRVASPYVEGVGSLRGGSAVGAGGCCGW